MKSGVVGRVLVSVFLIGIGVFALLVNLGTIEIPWNISGGGIVWLVIFGLGGTAFLGIYLKKGGDTWWAVIPGLALIGMGIILSDVFPVKYQFIAVAGLLALLGLGFLGAYLGRKEYWGLILPAGVLITAACHTLLSNSDFREYSDALFWLGVGVTLLLVYWAAPIARRWVIFPAIACGFLAVVAGAGAIVGRSLLLPGALILLGGIIVWRAFRRPGSV